MRNLFALVGAGTIAFVGLGWYLDWYKLSRQPSTSGTQRVQVDLHPEKILEDGKKGIERGGEIIDRFRENNNSQPQPPANPPAEPNTGNASQFFSPTSSSPPPQ
jgi:hypothetical protein